MVANFARPPRGGDTDQIRAVAAGECGIALTNSYYLVRLMRSDKPEDRAVAQQVGLVWPDQKGYGTHMNISGGGLMRNAPNRENAVRFLEYLASDAAQAYFASGNNEWPVVKTAVVNNPELASLGKFKADPLSAAQLAQEPGGRPAHRRSGGVEVGPDTGCHRDERCPDSACETRITGSSPTSTMVRLGNAASPRRSSFAKL